MMTFAVLSIGSNIDCRESNIAAMERELGAILEGMKSSDLMETSPVDVDEPQPFYLNKIVAGRYVGNPYQLLDVCHAIELSLGRVREKPKSARTADVDILIFGDMVINDGVVGHDGVLSGLVVPHPQILNRRFCLEGLMQIDPSIIIPGAAGATVGELYKNMGADVAAQDVLYRLYEPCSTLVQ
jgi:2-amino-4-hydroxy-6-hydroxymethyldihydropteridine diphosphokinase